MQSKLDYYRYIVALNLKSVANMLLPNKLASLSLCLSLTLILLCTFCKSVQRSTLTTLNSRLLLYGLW